MVDEPSIVAKDRASNKTVAIGRQAQQMHGKTHENIKTVRPLKDGVIADFQSAEDMIKGMIRMIQRRRSLFNPSLRMVICIPSGITEVEKRAVKDSAEHAGAKEVFLIHEPMAAAIGIGIDVEEPMGNMIIDIGGGTSEIAVIALGGIVTDKNIRVAGDEFTQDIEEYMRRQHNILVGERTAEQIKIEVGSALTELDEPPEDYAVRGRDLMTGIPKEIRKLLIDNPVSSTTGFNSALVNIGKVKNSGFELELRTKNITSDNFSWNSTLLLSSNDNELVSFGDSDGQIQNIDAKRAAEWVNSVGNPISSFYGWVVDRDIPLEYIKNPYHPIGAEAQDVYVKDLNGDGLIDDDDKTILGDPYADLVWSFANDFKFGNFDFSFMIQGSEGAMVRNMGDQYIFNHFNSSQDFDKATTPDQHLIKQKIFTNDIVQDASYLALRNINIGYRIPKSFLEELNVTSARIYASGQNLFYNTEANYTGFNPESINTTSPTTYGYQRAGSPVFSTVSLGLNIEL